MVIFLLIIFLSDYSKASDYPPPPIGCYGLSCLPTIYSCPDYINDPGNCTFCTQNDFVKGTCIDTGSIPIAEPVTWITNWMLFAECCTIGYLLLNAASVTSIGKTALWPKTFGIGFIICGWSWFFGGVDHGFAIPLNCEGRTFCVSASWAIIVSYMLNVIAQATFFVGSADLVLRGIFGFRDGWVLIAKLYGAIACAIYATVLIYGVSTPSRFAVSFDCTVIFAAPSFVLTQILFSLPPSFEWKIKKDYMRNGQTKCLVGWSICIIGVLCQKNQVSFGINFDENDLFHVIEMIGFFITYTGLRSQMQDISKKKI